MQKNVASAPGRGCTQEPSPTSPPPTHIHSLFCSQNFVACARRLFFLFDPPKLGLHDNRLLCEMGTSEQCENWLSFPPIPRLR